MLPSAQPIERFRSKLRNLPWYFGFFHDIVRHNAPRRNEAPAKKHWFWLLLLPVGLLRKSPVLRVPLPVQRCRHLKNPVNL
jgi:hypothetical protein